MNEITAPHARGLDRVRGFVDVLGTCEQWPQLPHKEAGVSAAFGARWRLPLPEGPITLDRVQLAPGAAGQESLPGDEFVLVLEGDVSFDQSDMHLKLSAGEAAVVLRGRPLDWRSQAGAKLIAMRCTAGGGAGGDTPVRVDQNAELSPSNPPAPEVLIGPTPSCRGHSDYRSPRGEFACGTWDSTPYHRRSIRFGHYELMYLLAGSVTLVDNSGREGRFQAGEVILFEQGGGASWESREYVKKIFSTYRPAT